MRQALSAPNTGSISVTVASIDEGHWGVRWSAFWEAEHASFSNPDGAVPDGNVNRKLGPGVKKQTPVQHH